MEHTSRAFEWIAVGVLVLAFGLTLLSVVRDLLRGTDVRVTYKRGREIFGRGSWSASRC
jgi:hypothetical protein